MEHGLDRLDKLGIHYNILDEAENGYVINYNRVAVTSWKTAVFVENPVTKLRDCDLCGRTSTPKKIQWRADTWGWNRESRYDYTTPLKDVLCMSCWNKIKPLVKREDRLREIKSLSNKLYREALKCRKLQTQAN